MLGIRGEFSKIHMTRIHRSDVSDETLNQEQIMNGEISGTNNSIAQGDSQRIQRRNASNVVSNLSHNMSRIEEEQRSKIMKENSFGQLKKQGQFGTEFHIQDNPFNQTKMTIGIQSNSHMDTMKLCAQNSQSILQNAENEFGNNIQLELQRLSNCGLNLQFYDFKTIKMQYQEEKDYLYCDKGGQDNSCQQTGKNLPLSYWTGGLVVDELIDQNEAMDSLNEFWTSQMDDTLDSMKGVMRIVFAQIFFYTITLFITVQESKYIIVLGVRSVLLIFIVLSYFFVKRISKASSTSLQKFRIITIISYWIIIGALNLELWMASSSDTSTNGMLYNDHEIQEIINVLIYEIYFVYFFFFRLRIFTFSQQAPVFVATFAILLAHSIITNSILQGLLFKVLYMQILFFFNSYNLFHKDLENFCNLQSLNEKNQQTDKLIQYLLPNHILQHFLMNPTASYLIAEKFDKMTILFADIAGFTRYSDQNLPETVVKMLRTLFTQFDQQCQHHKVFKVYTIGDCYVILGNTNHDTRDPPLEAYNVIMMAFQMIDILAQTYELVESQIDMRIGIHTGKIVGGLVGTQIVRYDIYGVDVMIANKMESNGQKGSIVVSQSTKEMIEERYHKEFIFTEKGDVYIKAIKANIKTYLCDKNPI